MGRKIHFLYVVVACIFLSFTLGCTRGAKQTGVNIHFPVTSDLSGMSDTEQLQTVILNLRGIPGKPSPWLIEKEYRDSGVVIGPSEPFTIDVGAVEKASNVTIQVLAIYKDMATGFERFVYGGIIANVSGTTNVDLLIKTQNQSVYRAEVNGRYLNASPPHPTGMLVAKYKPTDGLPDMTVWKKPIFGGYFEAFALEESSNAGTSAGLTFEVQNEAGAVTQTLFENLRLKFMGGGVFELREGSLASPTVIPASENRRLAIYKPMNRRTDSSEDGAEGDTVLYLGFFGPGSHATNNRVCYPQVQEGLSNMRYQTAPGQFGSTMDVRLDSAYSAMTPSKIVVLSGGVQQTLEQHYTHDGGSCTYNDENQFYVHHGWMDYAQETLAMKPPFRALNDFGHYPNYISGYFQSAPDRLILNWALMPGLYPAYYDGIDIIWKAGSYTDTEEDDERIDCQYMITKYGFSQVASGLTTDTHFFDTLGGVAVNSGNWMNHQFALCAYKMDGANKKYVGVMARSDCMGGCQNNIHTGWAPASATQSVSASSSVGYSEPSIGGVATYVEGVNSLAPPKDHLVAVQLASVSGISVGDEVLLIVRSEYPSGSCGNHQGVPTHPGATSFTRVMGIDSNMILVPNNSWISSMTGITSELTANADPLTGHCFVQALRVPHFRNLTVGNNASIHGQPFQFVLSPEGSILLRVNGVLTMGEGANFDVSEMGFKGGAGSNPNGAGNCGAGSSGSVFAPCSFAEGRYSPGGAGAGGGGAVGQGGNSSNASPAVGGGSQFSGGMGFQMTPMFFGGGGGSGKMNSGPYTAFDGGWGGGSIFVAAEYYMGPSSTPAIFKANGFNQPVGDPTLAGGGGGGSINVFFKATSGLLSLSAKGGSGGDNNNSLSGDGAAGNGGGGFIQALLCDYDTPGSTRAADLTWDTGKGTNFNTLDGAVNGSSQANNIFTRTTLGWEWNCPH